MTLTDGGGRRNPVLVIVVGGHCGLLAASVLPGRDRLYCLGTYIEKRMREMKRAVDDEEEEEVKE